MLLDKAFNIVKNPKYDWYQRGLASMVYNVFDKKPSGSNNSSGAVKNETMSDRKLAEELSKPIIRKFEKGKAYSSFKDNISDADLADIQLISKFNKEFWFLLSFIEIYSKYALVIPLKNKKVIAITKAFQNMLDESGHISNKI